MTNWVIDIQLGAKHLEVANTLFQTENSVGVSQQNRVLQILMMKCQTFSASCPVSVDTVELYQCTPAEDFSHGLVNNRSMDSKINKIGVPGFLFGSYSLSGN